MGCWRQLHFTSLATWRQGTTTAMGTMVTMRMTTAMLRCELACVRCVTTMRTAYHGSWWEWEILARLTNCGTNGGCFHFTFPDGSTYTDQSVPPSAQELVQGDHSECSHAKDA